MPMSPTLAQNLRALLSVDPPLAERICLPVEGDHVDGDRIRVHRTWHPLAAAPVLAPEGGFLFGVGLGEAVVSGLVRGPVTAWERDPWLLRQLLERWDLSDSIARGHLRLKLGADLLDLLDRDAAVHPVLGALYRNERLLLGQPLPARRALVVAGTLFVDDLADALRAEGFAVGTWDVKRLSAEELAHTAERWAPELVLCVNPVHGLTEACAQLGLPLRTWEIDPATDRIEPVFGATEHARVFTYRQAQVPVFEAANLHAEYLPLAANPALRHPVPADPDYTCDVAFVGNSMVERGQDCQVELIAAWSLWRGGGPGDAAAEAEAAVAGWLAAQAEDFSQNRLESILQEQAPAFLAACTATGRVDPVALLGEMAAADKRIQYVANLGQVGIQVWGDEAWAFTEQFGAVYRGSAGHRDELTAIYSGARIQIDIGRLYQQDMVTMRVFDAMACGGFVLAEHSEALEELFEIGVELDCYRDLDELLAKVEHWLAHPDEAAAIAARGREAILARHTIQQRVVRMIS